MCYTHTKEGTYLKNLQLIFTIASSKELLLRALKIAVVVGIILNIINQGDIIFDLDLEKINFLKMSLTFIVPFCVSMYTAVSMKIKFHVGEKAPTDATLKCKGCNGCIHIKQDQTIPFCETCHETTSWKVTSTKDNRCQQHK